MNVTLQNLTNQEVESLLKTPALISAIAAGSELSIQIPEKYEMLKSIHLSNFCCHPDLESFYQQVESVYGDHLGIILSKYSPFQPRHLELMKDELYNVFHITNKLDSYYADLLKESFKTYSKHISFSHPKVIDQINLNLL